MIRTVIYPALALAAFATAPALAQTAAPVTPAPAATEAAAPAPANAPGGSDEAFKAAMDKMHHGMMVAYTGDADVDFVRGMIPHHQGAIDMARIQLEYGKDPELRKMAEEIVAAQEKEIAAMQAWLEKNAPDAANADAAKAESLTADPATGAAAPVTSAPPAAAPADPGSTERPPVPAEPPAPKP